MAAPATEFDLSSEADWLDRPARSSERTGSVVAVFFALVGFGFLGYFLEHARATRAICLQRTCFRVTPPEYYLVYLVPLILLFVIALAVFASSRRPRRASPTRLQISEEGLRFLLAGGRIMLVPWPVGRESLTVVDQRSVNAPSRRKVAVEGTLAIPPGTRTAALSGPAIDAIVEAARARGLNVQTRHREADRSAGGLEPVTEYWIAPDARLVSPSEPGQRASPEPASEPPPPRESAPPRDSAPPREGLPSSSDPGYNPS
jgi:hypothetical protein